MNRSHTHTPSREALEHSKCCLGFLEYPWEGLAEKSLALGENADQYIRGSRVWLLHIAGMQKKTTGGCGYKVKMRIICSLILTGEDESSVSSTKAILLDTSNGEGTQVVS